MVKGRWPLASRCRWGQCSGCGSRSEEVVEGLAIYPGVRERTGNEEGPGPWVPGPGQMRRRALGAGSGLGGWPVSGVGWLVLGRLRGGGYPGVREEWRIGRGCGGPGKPVPWSGGAGARRAALWGGAAVVLVLWRCQETGPASSGAGLGSRGEEGAEGCWVYPGQEKGIRWGG